MAINQDFTRIKLQDAAAGLDGGGFAGAVVADEAIDFTRGDVDGQVIHRLFSPKDLLRWLMISMRNPFPAKIPQALYHRERGEGVYSIKSGGMDDIAEACAKIQRAWA